MNTAIKRESREHECFNVCWISVDEMMPDLDELVLCCLDINLHSAPKYEFMTLTDDGEAVYWCDRHGAGGDYPVTHWVPMPQPPKNYVNEKPEAWQ